MTMLATFCECNVCASIVPHSLVSPSPRMATKYYMCTFDSTIHVCFFCRMEPLVLKFLEDTATHRLEVYRLQRILQSMEDYQVDSSNFQPFLDSLAYQDARRFYFGRDVRQMNQRLTLVSAFLKAKEDKIL